MEMSSMMPLAARPAREQASRTQRFGVSSATTAAASRHPVEAAGGWGPFANAGPAVRLSPPAQTLIQRFKLAGPVPVRKKLLELAPEKYDANSAMSVAKEFTDWFSKKYKHRVVEHDFASNGEFLEAVDAMVREVDTFTDRHGYALEDAINTSKNPLIPIGYKGGNAAYKEDLLSKGLTSRGSTKPKEKQDLTDKMQLGTGEYITTEYAEAKDYAQKRALEGKTGITYRVFIDLRKVKDLPIMMKGASVREWWDFYKPGYDEEFDIVVAALSGKRDVIQYKVTPRAYHILTFEEIETVKPHQ
jgi:hypothetical protein